MGSQHDPEQKKQHGDKEARERIAKSTAISLFSEQGTVALVALIP